MTFPAEIQNEIDTIVKKCPESKPVFAKVVEYYNSPSRKFAKSFKCVITGDKMDKLPSDLFKLQMSKQRKLLFNLGKNQHLFSVENSLEEKAVSWTILESIKLMHSGTMYLCDSGIALYYAKHSFAIDLKNLKDIRISTLSTHNCTIAVNGKEAEYFPLEAIENLQEYCEGIEKPLILPQMKKKKNIVDKLMEDAQSEDHEEEDDDDDSEDEFKGAAGGNDSD